MSYDEFLASKRFRDVETGIPDEITINPKLFEFQRDITMWALRRGRAAIFADCGLGKTPMQLEWAKHVVAHTESPVLIVAPLAVSQQTMREGEKFGVRVTHARSMNDIVLDGVYVTNYEIIEKFDERVFGGVVLDESSILKSYMGKFRTMLIEKFSQTAFRLAATATPAPNDHMELANHAEFLGVMLRQEMLATFFVHDSSSTQEWRLKGHAEEDFWRWMASWAVSIQKPSDLGYDDSGYELPELRTVEHVVRVDHTDAPDGMLFRMPAAGLAEVRDEQRRTVEDRAKAAADIINDSDESWIVWVNRNDEADAVRRLIPDAVEVRGSDKPDDKARRMLEFSDGAIRVLVTKPSIAGFGMNWQHCANMAFVGLSYSYEQFYQASRRCWRFGQDRDVNCHVIIAETEGSVLETIRRKDADATKMHDAMTRAMAETSMENVRGLRKESEVYVRDVATGDGWQVHLGDCVDVVRGIDDESVHCSIFSPPFASLYTYSNSERDMGNTTNDAEFFEHFGFLIDELFRVMVPGRNVIVHCMNLPTSKSREGYIGMRDFRGDIIREFTARGFIYHSEVCIWKDPVTAMQRTKAHGLLYKTLRSDSARSRQGIPDHLVIFRKDGDNPKPITHTPDDFPLDDWQDYASPCWFDIDQSNVLNNYRDARDHKDERHICPLQLDVIERALRLWSAPDDLVLSPFAGIGSEGFVSLKMGRRFIGAELKPSYWRQACVNLDRATQPAPQLSLLDVSP